MPILLAIAAIGACVFAAGVLPVLALVVAGAREDKLRARLLEGERPAAHRASTETVPCAPEGRPASSAMSLREAEVALLWAGDGPLG